MLLIRTSGLWTSSPTFYVIEPLRHPLLLFLVADTVQVRYYMAGYELRIDAELCWSTEDIAAYRRYVDSGANPGE